MLVLLTRKNASTIDGIKELGCLDQVDDYWRLNLLALCPQRKPRGVGVGCRT